MSVRRAATARRISLGGEGNVLYPVLSSSSGLFCKHELNYRWWDHGWRWCHFTVVVQRTQLMTAERTCRHVTNVIDVIMMIMTMIVRHHNTVQLRHQVLLKLLMLLTRTTTVTRYSPIHARSIGPSWCSYSSQVFIAVTPDNILVCCPLLIFFCHVLDP